MKIELRGNVSVSSAVSTSVQYDLSGTDGILSVKLNGVEKYTGGKTGSIPLTLLPGAVHEIAASWTAQVASSNGALLTFPDTGTLDARGRDYCIYLVPDTDGGVAFAAGLDDNLPAGYTAGNCRKIGYFHTECADIAPSTTMIAAATSGAVEGDLYLIKAAADKESRAFYTKQITALQANNIYNTVTMAHPLAGWQAGDILPESVFCITFRPACNPQGMIFDADADAAGYGAIDIYLQSGTDAKTRSAYGVPPTRKRQQQNQEDDMRSAGKRLLTDEEFTAVALGSNECTAIKGAAEASIAGGTGGHVDTADRRMTSATGAEDCCGAVRQWLFPADASDSLPGDSAYDGVGTLSKQASWGATALVAGADWSNGGYAGSRSRGDGARSAAGAHIGARGASRVVRG